MLWTSMYICDTCPDLLSLAMLLRFSFIKKVQPHMYIHHYRIELAALLSFSRYETFCFVAFMKYIMWYWAVLCIVIVAYQTMCGRLSNRTRSGSLWVSKCDASAFPLHFTFTLYVSDEYIINLGSSCSCYRLWTVMLFI